MAVVTENSVTLTDELMPDDIEQEIWISGLRVAGGSTTAVYTSNILSYGETVEPDTCEHIEVIDEAKAPACTQAGLTEGSHCSACGKVFRKQNAIPPKGHTIAFDRTDYETEIGGESLEVRVVASCGHTPALEFSIPKEMQLIDKDGMNMILDGKNCGVVQIEVKTDDEFKTSDECSVIIHAQERMVMPKGLVSIEENAFFGLPVEEVVLSESVEWIRANAFAECRQLKIINLPDHVQIESGAFEGCDSLVILCAEGSAAQCYAEENGIPYVMR